MRARRDPAQMCQRDGHADRAVAAHAEVADVVEEDHARRAGRVARLAEQGADQHVGPARLVHDGRAERGRAATGSARRRSANGPPPRSGPPAITTRVGSPPVCESITWMRCMSQRRRSDFKGAGSRGRLANASG